ncbi:MAG TPA: hypothetical protein VKT49_23835 [Bryobacteraceae bacterium]|nr:hypothetical protein [Bryobacteraceae bacterium]
MRRFLEFTIESALSGTARELKEYVIGLEVFDRSTAHDPRIDPIVRVEARRLRAKLRDFYAREGAESHLIIEYPRGSYVPQFRLRSELPAAPVIAVLPFAARRGSNSVRFADGLTRELIHELSRSETVQLFSGETPLRVRLEALLTGSVRQDGPRLRVTAQLLSTGDNQHLWSAEFQSPASDPVTAQKQIAFATAHALLLHFEQK